MIERLRAHLRAFAPRGVALAFSGGVDSALLLAVLGSLRDEADFPLLAAHFHSVLHTAAERADAERLAEALGVELAVIEFDPLAIPGVVDNPPDRCYRCKRHLFEALTDLARSRGLATIIDGTNADDAQTFRPGRRALRECGVVSPLEALGIGKAQVRALAASLGLDIASKPAAPCLATRFPYGTRLDAEAIARVAEGEQALRALLGADGDLRLRVHGAVARIEIEPGCMAAALAQRERIAAALEALGFEHVALDLAGFRSGSMDGPTTARDASQCNTPIPMSPITQHDLVSLVPAADSFIGIDSDGCVFDTMRAKQCLHFHPLIIRHWGLETIEPQLREVAEFVNLHSRHRGSNRFPALLKTFELLRARPGVAESGVKLPETRDLRAYCESGLPLGNASLAAEVARTGSPELAKILAWSLDVNREIERNMAPVPPFPEAVASLRLMQGRSDAMVVSQTPEEALLREWRQHGIASLVRIIAGQELGAKAEQMRLATEGKYAKARILLIGDAPGDLAAARAAGIAFYPIQPGDEAASWQRFHDGIYDLFLAGRYRAEAESRLIAAFEASLDGVHG